MIEYILIFLLAEAAQFVAILLKDASQAEGFIVFVITFLGLLILRKLYE